MSLLNNKTPLVKLRRRGLHPIPNLVNDGTADEESSPTTSTSSPLKENAHLLLAPLFVE